MDGAQLAGFWRLDGDLDAILAELAGHEHEWILEKGVLREEVPEGAGGELGSIAHLIVGDVVYRCGTPRLFYGGPRPELPDELPLPTPGEAPAEKAPERSEQAEELSLDLGAHGLGLVPEPPPEPEEEPEVEEVEAEAGPERASDAPREGYYRPQWPSLPPAGDQRNPYFHWYLCDPSTGEVQSRGWRTWTEVVQTPDGRYYEERIRSERAPR